MSLLNEEKFDRVVLLTLNRPEKRNALNAPLVVELESALLRLEKDENVSVICLQGAGEHFCSGADLKELKKTEDVLLMNEKFCSVLQILKKTSKTTMALVEGSCMGGGLGIALACDLTYACDDALFATPEIKHGLWPFMISPLILENMPRKKALEMMMTGGGHNARTACELGLVGSVVPRDGFLDYRSRLFDQFSSLDPVALAAGKKSLETANSGPLCDILPNLSKELFTLAKRRASRSS